MGIDWAVAAAINNRGDPLVAKCFLLIAAFFGWKEEEFSLSAKVIRVVECFSISGWMDGMDKWNGRKSGWDVVVHHIKYCTECLVVARRGQ